MKSNKSPLKTLVILSMLSIATVGCGKKEAKEESKADSQVVAKVNGDEISIHQVNFQLGRMGQLTEGQGKEAAKQILARLVDQQLLKQKAIEAKLDRDPRVLQALESSKDQILAQAYLEQEMQKVAKPSATEVDAFYNEHPELFQDRRVFNLQELSVEAGKDKVAEIEQAVNSKNNITEIAEWLKSNNYKFGASANVRTAEQLPSAVLSKLQSMQNGESVVLSTERSTNILLMVASQSQPITKEKAIPVIEQYFLNQNRNKLAKAQIESLTKAAKIEYVGPFADMKPDAEANANQPAKKDFASASETSGKGKPIAAEANKSDLAKGLAGL